MTAPEPAAPDSPEPAAGTGHPGVDAALAGLAGTADLAPAEQVAAYEEAHRALTQTLAGIDES